MTEEARKAAAAYMREWRKKNPDKQEEYRAAYWKRKAEAMRIKKELEKIAYADTGGGSE